MLKDDGDFLRLQFKKYYMQPLIIKGWEEVKELHNFSNNVEVILSYYDRNVFKVQSYRELDGPSTIPSFHSRSQHPTETIYCDLKLTEKNIRKQELVKFTIFFSDHSLYFSFQ